MNLSDPLRPRIGHSPALKGGLTVFPRLTLKLDGDPSTVELAAMLPVGGESRFISKEFRATVKTDKLPELIARFYDDPEQTLSDLFGSDPTGFVPAIALEPTSRDWARDQRRISERRPAPVGAKASFTEEDDD